MVDSVLIESGDSDAAENVDAMFGHPSLVDTVHPDEQFTVTPDTANDAVDMSAGKAFIGLDTVTTPDGDTRRRAMVTAEKDAQANVALANVNAVNYIYLQADLGTGDSPQWVVNDTGTAPSDDSLLVAIVEALDPDADGSAESIDVLHYPNRGSDLVAESLTHPDGETIDLEETSFDNVGFDAVDLPTVVRTYVDDFESGTEQSIWNGWSDFNVVSDPAGVHGYVIRSDTSSSGYYLLRSPGGAPIYPQAGDEFSMHTRFTKANDRHYFRWADGPSGNYNISFKPDNIELRKDDNTTSFGTDNFGERLDEWLRADIKWGESGYISVDVYDSDDNHIGHVDNSGSLDEDYKGGPVQYRHANLNSAPNFYSTGIEVTRRSENEIRETRRGTTELGNEVTPKGGIHTGPAETEVNALRSVLQQAPVTDGATQGDVSLLTLLQSGLDPAVYLERILDGQGGAYAHQLQAPLGRFARLNSNLSWEYDTLANVPNWFSGDDGGGATWTFNVNSRPRRIHAEHDGADSGSDEYGGVKTRVLSTYQSLEEFRVVFHDVSYTDANENNLFVVGITDQSPGTDVLNNGNGIFWADTGSGENQNLQVVNGGSPENTSAGTVEWGSNVDVAIEYDGSEARVYVDGVKEATLSFSVNADFAPVIWHRCSSNNSTGEAGEAQQVTLEPLAGVLN